MKRSGDRDRARVKGEGGRGKVIVAGGGGRGKVIVTGESDGRDEGGKVRSGAGNGMRDV